MRSRAVRTSWPWFSAALLMLTSGCLTYVKSTSGGRKEARRECLADARAAGLTVLQIGEAVFQGAGRYEVPLTVEKEGTPAHAVACVYDFREAKTDFHNVPAPKSP
ncbi:MAG: hypothetical protein U0132_15810 [Gemmatimonadaceae bacterium]